MAPQLGVVLGALLGVLKGGVPMRWSWRSAPCMSWVSPPNDPKTPQMTPKGPKNGPKRP